MLCQFELLGSVMVCAICGKSEEISDTTIPPSKYYRNCSVSGIPSGSVNHPPSAGLGDLAEHLLASLGVTKEKYLAVKQACGLPPTCNCDARKEWLNRVSDWLRGQ